MEKKTLSPQLLQKRKFFVVLPLLVVPFLTLLFWILDGGKDDQMQASVPASSKGLNLTLPQAYLPDDTPLDKLSYYEKANLDSSRLEKLIQNDPYYRNTTKRTQKVTDSDTSSKSAPFLNESVNSASSLSTPPDPLEAQVYQRLEQLNTALQKADTNASTKTGSYTNSPSASSSSLNKHDIDRLEQMMNTMRDEPQVDPEMQQLNSMLEKILDIQHPERIQAKTQQAPLKATNLVLPIALPDNEPVNLLVNDKLAADPRSRQHDPYLSNNSFYSLSDVPATTTHSKNAIPAVVHETQTLVDGSIIKLRLLQEVLLNGVLLPEGSLLYGVTSLNGERLHIKINSIHFHNSLYPVELAVFDLDGLTGLYIPGAITRDVAKQSADRAAQGIGLSTLNSSLGAQAANAGIEMAKTLFSKKTKLVKVTVKAGYQVLLQNQKVES